MPKIKISMSLKDIVLEMSEGDPGAIIVCMRLVNEGGDIDKDAREAGFLALTSLDALEVYGPDIWLLYKDVAGENLSVMMCILRAHQFGLQNISKDIVHHAIDFRGEGVDIPGVTAALKKELPNFTFN
jgi:hypothetical protein